MNTQLENFETSFRSGSGGCRRECICGREFYNLNGGWVWEDGELEGLKKRKATCLEWTVGTIIFEGKEYVVDCDCWHKRAEQIMAFIDGHNQQIAKYLTEGKKRKQAEADHSPVVG